MDPEIGEPPVKKERLDEQMVNYEVLIDVPVAVDAEIDPLLPVNDQEPADRVQPSGMGAGFARPTKRESEFENVIPESDFLKIDSVKPNFALPSSQMSGSSEIENPKLTRLDRGNLTPAVRQEIWSSIGEEIEEVTTEDSNTASSNTVDSDFQRVVSVGEPALQQRCQRQQAPGKKYASSPKAQLVKPSSDQLCVRDSVNGVSPMSNVSKQVTRFTNALQGQKHPKSGLANLHPLFLRNRLANSVPNAPALAGVLERPGARRTAANVPNALSKNATGWQSYSSVAMPVVPSSYRDPSNGLRCRRQPPSSLEPAVPSPHYVPSSNLPPLSNQQPYLPLAAPASSHKDSPNQTASKSITVTTLLKKPLLSGAWTFEQKKAIIKSPRPRPPFGISPITHADVSIERLYNQIPWLCGSSHLRKFFCWPCLLFSKPSSSEELWFVWAKQVLSEEFNLLRGTHEVSSAHLAADKTLSIWLRSLDAPVNSNNEPPVRNSSRNDRVCKNRKLLSLLVQSICYLRKERCDAQIEDYAVCFFHIVLSHRELRETLKEFQGDLSTESAADFVFNHADAVEEAVGKFVNSKISDEMKNARFVTLVIEDLSSIVEKSYIAVIAHFVDRSGEVQERIIELNEISHDRSAGTIFALFQSIVFKFGLRLKVSGFTYSATLVRPFEIAAFNERVERLCPIAKPFHHQRHNLQGMLFGALSHLDRNCGNFFVTMTEFQKFFKENHLHVSPTFYQFVRLNSQTQPKYDFDYGFVTTLKRCYSSVLQTISSILSRPAECPYALSAQGAIFMSFLQDISTRFMITLISQLDLATADVAEALQGEVKTNEWKLLIRRAIEVLINIKNYGFEDVYLTAMSPVLFKAPVQIMRKVSKDLVLVFDEILETAVIFLRRRFDIVEFGYVDLVTVADLYYKRMHLRAEDVEKVRSQIVQYLAQDPKLRGKSLAEAVKYFHDHDLATVVPEYAAFLDFALTIPSSRSSLHCPAVDRILELQRARTCKPLKDFIWMEKELLAAISRQRKLTEAVIDIIVTDQNTSTKEFSYRDIGGHVSLSID